jgi:hypothetical protein
MLIMVQQADHGDGHGGPKKRSHKSDSSDVTNSIIVNIVESFIMVDCYPSRHFSNFVKIGPIMTMAPMATMATMVTEILSQISNPFG